MKLPEMLYYAFVHERSLLRRADAVLATYDQLAPALKNRCGQVFISYNGVDARRFAPDEEHRNRMRKGLEIAEGEIVVLLAGIMSRQKGMHLGIEALGRLVGRFPTLRLLVAGAGPEEESLRAVAGGSPLRARVDFVGDISQEQAVRIAETVLGDLEGRVVPSPVMEPPTTAVRPGMHELRRHNLKQAVGLVGFVAPPMLTDEAISLGVLNGVMTGLGGPGRPGNP